MTIVKIVNTPMCNFKYSLPTSSPNLFWVKITTAIYSFFQESNEILFWLSIDIIQLISD